MNERSQMSSCYAIAVSISQPAPPRAGVVKGPRGPEILWMEQTLEHSEIPKYPAIKVFAMANPPISCLDDFPRKPPFFSIQKQQSSDGSGVVRSTDGRRGGPACARAHAMPCHRSHLHEGEETGWVKIFGPPDVEFWPPSIIYYDNLWYNRHV